MTVSANIRFRKRSISFAVGMLLFFGLAQPVGAATYTIDTTGSWAGLTASLFGANVYTQTYGETFVAPAANILTDFTFYIKGESGETLNMKAYVYAWSPTGYATSTELYGSSTLSLVGNGAFQSFTVDTGGTPLAVGNTYVAFLTVSNGNYGDGSSTVVTSWGYIPDVIPDVQFVYYNSAGDFSSLFGPDIWDGGGTLAFQANFTSTSVPEPGTMMLLGSGLFGITTFGRKKFRK